MNRAEEYKRRLAEKRAKEASQRATAEITLPSGATWLCCRPPLEVWATGGRFPQSFLNQILGMQGKTDAELEQAALKITPADNVAAMIFIREAITFAAVEPKLRLQDAAGNWIPLPDDKPEDAAYYFNAADIDPEDFEFLMGWILRNCPGVPVKTKGGEVSMNSLAQFRQEQPGSSSAGAKFDGSEVRAEAERAVGNFG